MLVGDGGVIAPGYNSELDEWRALADGASDYLDRLEIREREKAGAGYAQGRLQRRTRLLHSGQPRPKAPVPIHYVRRQTLKNAERYIIPGERVRRQSAHLQGQGAGDREKPVRRVVRSAAAAPGGAAPPHAGWPSWTCWPTWPSAPTPRNYACPTMSEQPGIRITEGRHPVVEQVLVSRLSPTRSPCRHSAVC
ncbi:hypothetical protein M8494_22900 [Serratia ureilytica]